MNSQIPRRRWFQFSLGSLLIFTALVAVVLAGLMVKVYRARALHRQVEVARQGNMDVYYDDELDAEYDATGLTEPHGTEFLRGLLTNEYFRVPTKVTPNRIFTRPTDAAWKAAGQLEHLQSVDLYSAWLSPSATKCILQLSELRDLRLGDSGVKDSFLQQLEAVRVEGQLKHLTTLKLGNNYITDAGLEHLRGFHSLRHLDVSENHLSNVGQNYAIELRKLQFSILASLRLDTEQQMRMQSELFGHVYRLDQTKNVIAISIYLGIFNEEIAKGRPGRDAWNYLDVWGRKLTDQDLFRLQWLTDADYEGLTGQPTSDVDCAYLQQIHELAFQIICNRRVTDKGVAKLKAALPNCTIEY